MKKRFVNRLTELDRLDKVYRASSGQMMVIYGRRRVGKTALLSHWLDTRGYKSVFWTADRISPTVQLRGFSHALRRFAAPDAEIPAEFSYGSWENALLEVEQLSKHERLVVVLDEFTYLIEADPALPSILQRLWDHRLQHANVMLVLTGSHAGMIEREVLSYRSPLYGRAKWHIPLQPLPFGAVHHFLPGLSAADRLTLYGCVGGIPQYLELFSDQADVFTNLEEILESSMILDDAGALLRDQLSEPRNYMAVVQSIAAGYTKLSEIATMAGMAPTNATKYLSVLQHLGIVARQVPATVRDPDQSRQGRYAVTDPYLRFFFRFLSPSLSYLERGQRNLVMANLTQHLAEFTGTYAFEELCREWIYAQADTGALGFVPRRVGSVWGYRQPNIDVVALNPDEHTILLGECKWWNEAVPKHVVDDLLAKAPKVIPEGNWRVIYALFSKSGFTTEAIKAMGQNECRWVDLKQLDADLRA